MSIKKSVDGVANFSIGDKAFPCYQSNKYGNLIAPTTFSDLCFVLNTINSPKDAQKTDDLNNDSVNESIPNGWRGQANIEWDLDSSAYRRLKNADNKKSASFSLGIDEIAMTRYENMMLNQARSKGFHYQNGKLLSDLEILASIQHYDGATRLIDFTKNAFTALWFACQDTDNIDKYGVLFCADLNPQSRIFMRIRQHQLSQLPISNLLSTYPDKILVWEPSHLFERMRVQQSLFFFGKVHQSSWSCLSKDKFFKNNDEPLNTHGGFLAIAIPPELKKEMTRNWAVLFGYDFKTIFPDIEGFGKHHKQKELLDADDFDSM